MPQLGWKVAPTTGHVLGTVRAANGTPFDQVGVELRDADTDVFLGTRVTDGSGYFGFVDLAPGRYKVGVDVAAGTGQRVVTFLVSAGSLSEAEVVLRPR